MTNTSLRVTFILPGAGCRPIGGTKVIYEHANHLARKGYRVAVVHTSVLDQATKLYKLPHKMFRYIQRSIDRTYRPDSWFQVDPTVHVVWVPSLDASYIPDADIVVATAWQTAEWVSEYGASKGKQYYFVQDYEYYMCGTPEVRDRMRKTYLSGMRNVIISPACAEMLISCKAPVYAYIPNGIDFRLFTLKVGLEDSSRKFIGFPTRREIFKGTQDAISALNIVRKQLCDQIYVWSFGTRKPSYVPDWIDYYRQPSDEELSGLYNHTSIFITPSYYEGWGLPGAEAMACGAALVSTDSGGVRAYAEHGRTALLSTPGNITDLANNTLQLIRNLDLRISIAKQGNAQIQRYTWKNSSDLFEAALLEMDFLLKGME